MIGKIVKGTSFSGCVNYVLKEDKSRLLKAVGVYGSPEEIAEQFELQTLLNDKVKNTVGHISLSFSAQISYILCKEMASYWRKKQKYKENLNTTSFCYGKVCINLKFNHN